MTGESASSLLTAAQGGRRAAIARLLSMVERGGASAREVSRVCHPCGGTGFTIGITGAPGAGKSTLTNMVCTRLRRSGATVGVLAIDPTSPFSGGALLGDRVRMGDQYDDDGVFIRSMATRGHLGGLALATPGAVDVLDACGFAEIVMETVGVGQVEVEVAGAADTTVVVVNPGWGDAVQANKAGLMEIADVFVINKADRPGAGETRRDLEQMLALSGADGWVPPIVAVVATEGAGVDEAVDAMAAHRSWAVDSGELGRRRAAAARRSLEEFTGALVRERLGIDLNGPRFDAAVEQVLQREIDPWVAADSLVSP